MPVQTQTSTLAQRFGNRIAAANAEHKDKPLDTGFKRLPPGIRDGIAKLGSVALKYYGQDEKIVALRGQEYLQVTGVVKHPKKFNNETTEGHQMFLRVPLCDIPANPANSMSKPVSFADNWYDFQQFFLRFGFVAPNETQQTDPQGTKTWAYYQGALQALQQRIAQGGPNAPHYEFTTRGWTPPATQAQPKPEEKIFETWGKACIWTEQHDPAAGVNESQPDRFTPPTQAFNGDIAPQTQTSTVNGAAPPPSGPVQPQYQPGGSQDPADIVAALIEIAMNDPDGATTDGAAASAQLEEMAWQNGWTAEQTGTAADWAAVGDMALNKAATNAPTQQAMQAMGTAQPGAVVGMKRMFNKRDANGNKLVDKNGTPFPAQEVEVVAVNEADKTCTVKTTKDGKDVVHIKTKKPIDVRWEWLE